MDVQKLSLVVAAFNEEHNIKVLYERIAAVDWSSLKLNIELIFVDDRSTDSTPSILRELSERDSRVKWIRFSRNFGSHMAYTAGLERSGGDAAVILAADLQDPPEIIEQLIGKWRTGAKVVWAVRSEHQRESVFSGIGSRLYYFLMRNLTALETQPTGADFVLLDKIVIATLRTAPERNTSLLALIQWFGFDQQQIYYSKVARAHGKSKWTFAKRLKLAIDSFVSFSYFPIRIMSLTGVLCALLGFCYAAFLIVRKLTYAIPIEGWTSVICVVLILSGVQLVMVGVLGEYLWRAFDEGRKRPRFIVESSSAGFEDWRVKGN